MYEINKHLKAEAKIKEVHAILDEINGSNIDVQKKNKNPNNRKWIVSSLMLVLGAIVLWQSNTKKSTETSPLEVNAKRQETKQKTEEKLASPEISKQLVPTKEKKPSAQKEMPIAAKKADKTPTEKKDKISSKRKTIPHNPLIADSFTPVPWENNRFRSSSETAPDALKSAIKKQYNAANYKEVLSLIAPLLLDYPSDWELVFYKGVSDFHAQDFENAIETFRQIIDQDDNLFLEDAEWYLVGALIFNYEKDQAKNNLKQKILAYPSHKHYENARNLLSQF